MSQGTDPSVLVGSAPALDRAPRSHATISILSPYGRTFRAQHTRLPLRSVRTRPLRLFTLRRDLAVKPVSVKQGPSPAHRPASCSPVQCTRTLGQLAPITNKTCQHLQ